MSSVSQKAKVLKAMRKGKISAKQAVSRFDLACVNSFHSIISKLKNDHIPVVRINDKGGSKYYVQSGY